MNKVNAHAQPKTQLLQQAIGIAPVGILITDLSGKSTYTNRFFCEISGFTEEECINGSWLDAIHPEDKSDVSEAWQLCVAGEQEFRKNFRFLKPNLNEIWVRGSASRSVDETGNPTGLIVCFLDNSNAKMWEQKNLENQGKAQEMANLNQNIAETLPAVLYIYGTAQNKFTFINSKCKTHWGYERSEIIDKQLLSPGIVHPEDLAEVAAVFEGFNDMRNGDSTQIEFRMRHKLGHWIWCRDRICVFSRSPDGSPKELLGISQDITEQKETLLALDAERTHSIHSANMVSLGEMAGGIAHEINNPLSIITGKAYQLKKKMETGVLDNKQMNEIVARIEETAFRISKIIHGLRTFARNADEDPIQRTRVISIVQDTLELCQQRIVAHGIELRINVPENLYIDCRSVQIAQVLLNLLNNSHDAILDIPGRWIEVSAQKSGNFVELRVTDSGSGIPASIRRKIMQPFFTTKPLQKGTGLGLSVSKGIIESHRGEFLLDETSKNTSFVFRLPVTVSPADVKAA